jgi:hypothetical protein
MLPVLCTIAVGLAGLSCFTVGIIWSISEMTILGITLTAISIVAMVLLHWISRATSASTTITSSQEGVRYSTNNMKRNKSDTDLELIGRSQV